MKMQLYIRLYKKRPVCVGTKCPSFCQIIIKMVVITKIITSQVFVSLRKCVNQPTNLNAVGYPLHDEFEQINLEED